ncbi:MAG: nucleoside deaminase [Acidobacteria bacterium]|nr:nucleoside deaminase [Acidobacteriota bacterium]MCZ6725783.1 nucleoside deaminase [Acidobacteriota bacterium]
MALYAFDGTWTRDEVIVSRLLDVIEHDIAPLTQAGVRRGDKVFGAAVLRKSDGTLVVAGTNQETGCPLWHGEVTTIRELHELPAAERPDPKECLFLSTHEPCSLCLSAITWAGFDNFYYLFSYEDSRDDFGIPHDLRILDEVFGCPKGAYAAENAYWTSHDIVELAGSLDTVEGNRFRQRLGHLQTLYAEMSRTYQSSKDDHEIPLA